MFIKYYLQGKVVPDRSLKPFAHYSCNNGTGEIQETSNCLFPSMWGNLLQNFNNVKKTLPSLKEVLKQRLCLLILVKLAKSTQYLNTTSSLQLRLKRAAQRHRTNTFFFFFERG